MTWECLPVAWNYGEGCDSQLFLFLKFISNFFHFHDWTVPNSSHTSAIVLQLFKHSKPIVEQRAFPPGSFMRGRPNSVASTKISSAIRSTRLNRDKGANQIHFWKVDWLNHPLDSSMERTHNCYFKVNTSQSISQKWLSHKNMKYHKGKTFPLKKKPMLMFICLQPQRSWFLTAG